MSLDEAQRLKKEARLKAQKKAYLAFIKKCKDCKAQIIYSDTGLEQLAIDWCSEHAPRA